MSEESLRKYGYLVVEGQHDVAFIGKLLKYSGLCVVKHRKNSNPKKNVDSFWDSLIPENFPIEDDLLRRVPVPHFYQNETHSIAIHAAGGDSCLENIVEETKITFKKSSAIFAYGLILDADSETSPQERFNNLIKALKQKSIDLPFTKNPGEVNIHQKSHFGIYVLPNNQDNGTLEDILLDIAETNYADLKKCAQQYLDCFDQNILAKELKEFKKPAGAKKAQLAVMANVLKPGKSIQVSLQDNQWIDEKNLNWPILYNLHLFLQKLFGLAVPLNAKTRINAHGQEASPNPDSPVIFKPVSA